MLLTDIPEEILTDTRLSENAQKLLFEQANRIELKDRDLLLKEGSVCADIWFVTAGCLKLAVNKDGREINIQFGLKNAFITDLKSLRTELPSENYIQACGASTVIGFKKRALQQLYLQSDEISNFGRQLLEKLLSEQEEHSRLFKLHTPADRYHHIVANTPELLQKITLTELASYLGMSRETLTRIRQAR